jgi:hypothetical protein
MHVAFECSERRGVAAAGVASCMVVALPQRMRALFAMPDIDGALVGAPRWWQRVFLRFVRLLLRLSCLEISWVVLVFRLY